MAKTRTNRTGAGAPENNKMPLPTTSTSTNGGDNNETGAAMGGGATASMYNNIVWSGILPAAGGCIARQFNAMMPTEQKAATQTLHEFLKDPSNQLMQLNEGANKFTTLVNLPSSNIIRLVHGLGFGTTAIGSTSPVTGKVLMLSEEGDEALGVPGTPGKKLIFWIFPPRRI
eukprot:12863261-Ditylum_brightwellii.AAC.1